MRLLYRIIAKMRIAGQPLADLTPLLPWAMGEARRDALKQPPPQALPPPDAPAPHDTS